MRCIALLVLLCLLSACKNSSTNYQLEKKLIDLEYRVTLLENQLAAQEGSQNRVYNTPSPSATPPPNPSYKSTGKPKSYNGSTRSDYSPRCHATTKRGTQCKRSVRSGGYCWQHGG